MPKTIMKIIQASDAQSHFDQLLEDAASAPLCIEKNGRNVAVVMSNAEYERYSQILSKKDLVQHHHNESMERFAPLYDALSK